MSEEIVGYCKICGKELKRSQSQDWVYYNDTFACIHHHGVNIWYNEMYNKEVEKLKPFHPYEVDSLISRRI